MDIIQKKPLVFKFGGGIMNSAAAIYQLIGILEMYPNRAIIAVFSAFGKTTNMLEKLVRFDSPRQVATETLFTDIVHYHELILQEFLSSQECEEVLQKSIINPLLHPNFATDFFLKNPDAKYDAIVSLGERIAVDCIYTILKKAVDFR